MNEYALTLPIAIALILSGALVGFINTLAGGGSIISLSLLMFLGLPANIANGTNRIAILLQNFTATGSFKYHKVLDHSKALWLSIPSVIGSLIGALVAVDLNEAFIEKAIAVMMVVMVFIILYKPERWLKGDEKLIAKKVSFWQVILFFFIGLYAGFLQMGVGYALLAGIVLGAGYDLVRANAVKVLINFLCTIAAFIVFWANGQINWIYGLLLSTGTIAGAIVASRMAVKRGAGFVRWIMIVIIALTVAQSFNLIDIRQLFNLMK
jgi:uncharacterized membrane protein YfcA